MLEVTENKVRDVRVGGGEGGEELLEMCKKGRAVRSVIRVGCLKCIYVDDSEGVLWAEGKSGGLDATVTVGAMVCTMIGHERGRAKKSDGMLRKGGCVSTFGNKICEGRVRRVRGVDKILMGLLKSKYVQVGLGGKLKGTAG